MSALSGVGCVGASSIAQGAAGTFFYPHHHPKGRAAGVVSTLYFQGAAVSHFVQLAWLVVMGFLLHGRSVCICGTRLNPEISTIQGEGL
ncbi:MAG: hypothetical protein LBJ15_16765 [Comamonas sp.]|jgi:hypothetical protein|uniref:hypothetical protein n=1 Tax=Comamonas sp. TaxID=34028 RepID=UPI00282B8439|nr:hypothetical protein [Comamonas sp.]MDR0215635.1 hypothetical protein [Comamonas sp.]